jgi:hypothetical protein
MFVFWVLSEIDVCLKNNDHYVSFSNVQRLKLCKRFFNRKLEIGLLGYFLLSFSFQHD